MSGISSQAGLASLRAGRAFTSPPLLWASEATRLHDQLAAAGTLDPDTGERFTVRECDDALQGAVEAFNLREGARVIDLFEVTWRAIRPSVAAYLGLDADALDEVTL